VKYYRVSEEFLRELLLAAHTYHALESWGVDNWIGWGEAQHEYIKDCSVVDETHYEEIEDIVEADMSLIEECHCSAKTILETFLECMPQNSDSDIDF